MTLSNWPSDKPLDLTQITPTETKTFLDDMQARGERIARAREQGLIEVDQLDNFLKDMGKLMDLTKAALGLAGLL